MKKISQEGLINKLKLLVNELIILGVDVHKRSYHIAIWSVQRGLMTTLILPSSSAVLIKLITPFKKHIAQIVYEAGPTGFGLVRDLRASGFKADVIAPSRLPVLPGKQAKSDQKDCVNLSFLAANKLLQPIHIPSREEEAERQVMRLREQTIRKQRCIKQQIKSLLLQHGIEEPEGLENWSLKSLEVLRMLDLGEHLRFCLDTLLDELDWLKSQIATITKRINALAKRERHKTQVEHLRSIPGVGLITAMTYRTELLAPHRFKDGGQVARIIGLAPLVRQSGETSRGGSLMKSGNWRIRSILVEAAWRQIRSDEQAKKRFTRLLGNTGNNKKAIIGVARHLAICMWRISTRNEPYRQKAA